jgi:hypothetical protein
MEEEIYVVKESDGNLTIERWTKADRPLMKCGHIANATTMIPNSSNTGKIKIHSCVICAGIVAGFNITIDEPLDLTGRKAKCDECGKIVKSNPKLPFFSYRPDKEYDSYYSGCYGWD